MEFLNVCNKSPQGHKYFITGGHLDKKTPLGVEGRSLLLSVPVPPILSAPRVLQLRRSNALLAQVLQHSLSIQQFYIVTFSWFHLISGKDSQLFKCSFSIKQTCSWPTAHIRPFSPSLSGPREDNQKLKHSNSCHARNTQLLLFWKGLKTISKMETALTLVDYD